MQKNLLDIDSEYLKLTFVNGMNLSAASSRYCKDIESYMAGTNLVDTDENISYMLEHFNNLNLQTKEKEYIEIAKELFEMIPDKIERLADVFAEDIVLFKDLITARYEKVKDVENEERNIRLLKQTVEEYIRGKVPTIKIILLEDFIKTLDMILIKAKSKGKKTRKKMIDEESA